MEPRRSLSPAGRRIDGDTHRPRLPGTGRRLRHRPWKPGPVDHDLSGILDQLPRRRLRSAPPDAGERTSTTWRSSTTPARSSVSSATAILSDTSDRRRSSSPIPSAAPAPSRTSSRHRSVSPNWSTPWSTREPTYATSIASSPVSPTRVVQRLLGMAMEELGPAPARFAFLTLGSGGREEQTLLADQDNALLYEDLPPEKAEEAAEYFLALAALGCATGWIRWAISFCEGGVMAKNPRWNRPLSSWRTQFAYWIHNADPQELLELNMLFDFRCGQRRTGARPRSAQVGVRPDGGLSPLSSSISRRTPFCTNPRWECSVTSKSHPPARARKRSA